MQPLCDLHSTRGRTGLHVLAAQWHHGAPLSRTCSLKMLLMVAQLVKREHMIAQGQLCSLHLA